MKAESNSRLDVRKVMRDFEKGEQASSGRKGSFKINKPFEGALSTVLRVKPVVVKNKKK